MKKKFILACLVGVLAAPAVQAQMQIVLWQDLNNYSYGDAGEFNAVPNTALLSVNPTLAGYTSSTANLTAGPVSFQTFCVETGEYFTPGDTYDVVVNNETIPDDQFPSGNPITMGTAWLYSQFAAGTLGGYDYAEGSGRITTAGNLQQAIWYLQGDVTGLVNGGADGTVFYIAAQTALGANINNAANGAYGVVCLNLRDGNNQDQLMVVPEPGVLSFGLLLLPLGVNKVRTLFRKQTA